MEVLACADINSVTGVEDVSNIDSSLLELVTITEDLSSAVLTTPQIVFEGAKDDIPDIVKKRKKRLKKLKKTLNIDPPLLGLEDGLITTVNEEDLAVPLLYTCEELLVLDDNSKYEASSVVKKRRNRGRKSKKNLQDDAAILTGSETAPLAAMTNVSKLTKNAKKKLRQKNVEITQEKSAKSIHRTKFTPTIDINACNHDILELQKLMLRNQITEDEGLDPVERPAQCSSNRNKKLTPKKKNHKQYMFEKHLTEDQAMKLLKNGTLIEGVLRINPKNTKNAYISNPIPGESDYLITDVMNRNRALEGDIVLISVTDMPIVQNIDQTTQKTGKVVFIKQAIHPRTCVGILKLLDDKNRRMAVFTPRDRRVPKIYIPFTCWPVMFYEQHEKYANVLFVAKIDDWIDVKFASGTLLSNIGYAGELKVEAMAILAENGLDITPFPPQTRRYYPNSDFLIPDEEFAYRKDCREMCIFTIDPLTARDLDDAVSCRVLKNGNFEIGVHIADVSYFLEEGTILNDMVSQKATTIYMVEKAYHMLPEDLCLLCSLLPNTDKLTFSVFWEITPNGEIKSSYFTRSVINSCTQLAYEHAQKMLENPDKSFAEDELPQIHGGWKPDDLRKSVCHLYELSKIFKAKRFESGALRIDQPKLIFDLDPISGLPNSYSIYENKESHRLIEEFMLLANMTVAKKIYEDFPRLAFLRRHPAPNELMLKELARNLEPLGIQLDISTAGKLQSSLSLFSAADCNNAIVLNALAVKPMSRALYFCADGCDDDDFWHYALSVPLYTHFTSPIRRYADIMVHRLLSASIGYRSKPNWDVNDVHSIAANCNKQKYNAKRAGEMSSEMYANLYILKNTPMIVKAVVVDVRMSYIDTVILDNGFTRRIYFNSKHHCNGNSTFFRNEKSEKMNRVVIKWPTTENHPESEDTIQLFSIVNICLDKADDPTKIALRLVHAN